MWWRISCGGERLLKTVDLLATVITVVELIYIPVLLVLAIMGLPFEGFLFWLLMFLLGVVAVIVIWNGLLRERKKVLMYGITK
jgi:hypothetical protein